MPNEQQFIEGAFKAGLNPQQVSQALQVYREKNKPKTISGFLGNVGSSALKNAQGIVEAGVNVFNPNMEKNTVANLARLGVGTAQLLDPTEVLGTGQQETARNVGRFYDQRYGITDLTRGRFKEAGQKAFNSFYNDPVGVALDASAVVGGAGALAKGAGFARAGKALTTASEVLDPIALAGKGVGRVTSGAGEIMPTFLQKQANKVATRGLGQPAQLEKVEGLAGRSAGQLMDDYRITDRSVDSAMKATDLAGELYDQKLLQANKNISVGQYLKNLDAQIKELEPQALLSETAKSELEALKTRRAGIETYLTRDGSVPLEITAPTAKAIKSQIYKDVKPSTFNPQYQGSGGQLAAKRAYQGLISSIDEVAPGTRQLGRDQAALIQMQDIFERAAKRGEGRQLLSLPKLIGSAAGGSLAGIPGAVGGAVFESIVNSPQASMVGSRVLRNTGKVLEKPATQKIFSTGNKAMNAAYSFGKASSRALPSQLPATTQSTRVKSETQGQLTRPQSPQAKTRSYSDIVPPTSEKAIFSAKAPSVPLPKTAAKLSSTMPFGKVKRVKAGAFSA